MEETDVLINDPNTTDVVNVTGWDLDRLADNLASVRADMIFGNQRPLSADEIETLEHETLGLPEGNDDWWTQDGEVATAVGRLGAVIDEAIFQRDLSRALALLAAGQELATGTPEWAAYDRYILEINERLG